MAGSRLAGRSKPSRNQAGARVQAREDFADLLLRSSVDCVTVLDRQGRLIFMNEAGLRLTEVDDFCDIEGTALTDVLPIETRDLVEAAIERGRRGEPSQITAFCPTAKGTPRWWEIRFTPVPDPMGCLRRSSSPHATSPSAGSNRRSCAAPRTPPSTPATQRAISLPP
jgi:PAS domain-containing protein